MNATSAVAVTGCAQHFAEATANPPFLLDLGPVERGTTGDDVQWATSCRAFRRLNESSSDRLIAPGRWWIHHRGMLFFVRDGSLMDHPRRELAWR